MMKKLQHSRYGSGKGKHWTLRGTKQKRELIQKQLGTNRKIIENKPELMKFYLEKLAEITTSGQKGLRGRQEMAIELTKEFAKENKIPWRR